MEVLIVLVPFVLAGLAVIFIAFSGGPSAAREAYLTRGGRVFTVPIAAALPRARRGRSGGRDRRARRGRGRHRPRSARRSRRAKEELGKQLFIQNCKSCHTLEAVQAHGVTGPNLDELGGLDKQRVLNAIKRGGTGTGRMPPGLLEGEDADAVATYVADVAGR